MSPGAKLEASKRMNVNRAFEAENQYKLCQLTGEIFPVMDDVDPDSPTDAPSYERVKPTDVTAGSMIITK